PSTVAPFTEELVDSNSSSRANRNHRSAGVRDRTRWLVMVNERPAESTPVSTAFSAPGGGPRYRDLDTGGFDTGDLCSGAPQGPASGKAPLVGPRRGAPGPDEKPTRNQGQAGMRVSSDASGRQANRNGAVGWVPTPADTCSQVGSAAGHRCRPRAIRRSRSQLVTSAPTPGTRTCP